MLLLHEFKDVNYFHFIRISLNVSQSFEIPDLKNIPILCDLIQDRNQGKGECVRDHTPCLQWQE